MEDALRRKRQGSTNPCKGCPRSNRSMDSGRRRPLSGGLDSHATDSPGKHRLHGAASPTYTASIRGTERPTFATDDLLSELTAGGATVRPTSIVQQRGILTNLFISFAPILLLVAFHAWMFRRPQAAMAGGLLRGCWQKRVDPETVRVTFDDVAAIDEVEAEINEIVDLLKDPEKYRRVGARAPKGVLLRGALGTGKTLLARATTGEAGEAKMTASHALVQNTAMEGCRRCATVCPAGDLLAWQFDGND